LTTFRIKPALLQPGMAKFSEEVQAQVPFASSSSCLIEQACAL
jgi:hypothetical protein